MDLGLQTLLQGNINHAPRHRICSAPPRRNGERDWRLWRNHILCSASIDKLAAVHGWDCSHHEGVPGGGGGGRANGGPRSSPARRGPQCLEYGLGFLPLGLSKVRDSDLESWVLALGLEVLNRGKTPAY
ncbi:hypothetical protein ACJJTC_019336 [Scirpophaga incertulas]